MAACGERQLRCVAATLALLGMVALLNISLDSTTETTREDMIGNEIANEDSALYSDLSYAHPKGFEDQENHPSNTLFFNELEKAVQDAKAGVKALEDSHQNDGEELTAIEEGAYKTPSNSFASYKTPSNSFASSLEEPSAEMHEPKIHDKLRGKIQAVVRKWRDKRLLQKNKFEQAQDSEGVLSKLRVEAALQEARLAAAKRHHNNKVYARGHLARKAKRRVNRNKIRSNVMDTAFKTKADPTAQQYIAKAVGAIGGGQPPATHIHTLPLPKPKPILAGALARTAAMRARTAAMEAMEIPKSATPAALKQMLKKQYIAKISTLKHQIASFKQPKAGKL